MGIFKVLLALKIYIYIWHADRQIINSIRRYTSLHFLEKETILAYKNKHTDNLTLEKKWHAAYDNLVKEKIDSQARKMLET